MRIGREQVEVFPDALAPGTEIGGWHVVQRLGVGGFGGAYKVQESARPGDRDGAQTGHVSTGR